YGLMSVGGLAHDLDIIGHRQQVGERMAQDTLVIGDEQPDFRMGLAHDIPSRGRAAGRNGSENVTVVPPDGLEETSNAPPSSTARSRMCSSPTPLRWSTRLVSKPMPSSLTSHITASPERSRVTATWLAPACRA